MGISSLSGTPGGDFASRSKRSESSQPGPSICKAVSPYAVRKIILSVAFSAVILPLMSQGELDLPLPEWFSFTVATSKADDCAQTAAAAVPAKTRIVVLIRITTQLLSLRRCIGV